MGFQLVIAEGKEAGREFVFEQASVLVGRTSDCDVVLYDPGVSRQHARIFSEGDKHFVEDMGSSNGTKVNGAIVKKKQLADGDAITLGPVVFNFSATFLDDAPPAQGEGSTRIVSVNDVKRSKGKGSAMAPEGAEAEQLAKLSRKSTQTMQAVSRPRASAPNLARAERSPEAAVSRPRPSAAAAGPSQLSAAERARIKREKPGATAGFTIWWKTATLAKRRLAAGAAGAVGLGVLGLVVATLTAEDEAALKRKLPPEPTELSNQAAERSFGLGDGVDYEHSDQKSFDFKFAAPVDAVVIIHFQARDMSAKEVLVSVNGTDVGEAPPDNMGVADRVNEILVPSQVLKKNETNIITFDSTRNPPGNDPWRIWNIWVEVALLPPLAKEVLLSESEKEYRHGLELMERQSIGAANLYGAWKAFRTAWLYMESMPEPRPERYGTSRDKMREAQIELDKQCAKILLEAQTFYNQRRWDEARRTLDHVAEFFPHRDQSCPMRAAMLREQFEL